MKPIAHAPLNGIHILISRIGVKRNNQINRSYYNIRDLAIVHAIMFLTYEDPLVSHKSIHILTVKPT